MKKILLTVAGSVLVAFATVQAQERSDTTRSTSDTTRTDEPSSEYRRTESGMQGETGTLEGRSGTQGQTWRDEDRVSVTTDELPDDLLKTLESDEYTGWENATIYRHKTSNEFMLVLQDNGEVKTFYFDAQGKALQSNDGMEQGNAMDQQTSEGGQVRSDQYTAHDPQWRDEDKVTITASQIPPAMLITLGDPKYKGWDKSKVYRNKSTGEYMIEIKDGTTTRVWYFDKSGKGISSGSQHTPDQSGAYPDDQMKQQRTDYRTGQGREGEMEETESPVQTQQPPQWKTEDRVVVEMGKVPASLRATLSGDERYKGWEKSTIYRNRSSNEYMIEIRDGSTSNTYYFDSEGQAKSDYDSDDQSSYRKDDSDDKDDADDNDGGRSGYSSTEERIPTGAKTQGTTGNYKTWRDEDKVIVSTGEIPVHLRTTLSDKKYEGWEKSSIYRNRSTNEYLVEIRNGDEVRTYYFDKDGKAIVIGTEEDQD